ncbi:MAG: AI-2E family transporter [Alphaproteobacteria bacterium]|nr:AI-2E family transporter [Alphaproteobacteria bacterium]
MTRSERSWFWVILFLAFGMALYVLRDVLLPFVAGMAVAYLLDPVVDRLERVRLPRGLATLIVLLAFFALTIGAILLLLPLIQTQVLRLGEVLPGYIDAVHKLLQPLVDTALAGIDGGTAFDSLPGLAGNAVAWVGRLLGRVVSGGVAVANVVSILLITPIVSFYLLRDWDRIVAAIDSWLPHAQADTIREQMRTIDLTLAAFVRGQGTVCLVLGVIYAVGLSLAGLDFGLVIGLFAGVISFVPFVGTIIGGLLSIGLALAQFDSWQPIAIIAAIFVFGQVIEGYFLTPNLVGDAVGLHPVWVIFSLLAGAALFGFLGVLLAVPAAAVAGVLTRFALGRYLVSPLHLRGIPSADDEATNPASDDPLDP